MFFNFLGYKLKVHFPVPCIHLEKIGICSPSVTSQDCAALRNKVSVAFHFRTGFLSLLLFPQALLIKLLRIHFLILRL